MNTRPTLWDAQVALHTGSQEKLGRLIGVSRRTISRWGIHYPSHAAIDLAKVLYPVDPELSARFAATAGMTPEALGLVPPPPPALATPPRKEPMPRAIDVVVCAAADAIEGTPRTARTALLAAVRAAREMGMELADVEAALTTKRKTSKD